MTAADVTVLAMGDNSARFVYNKDGLEIFRVDGAEGAVTETQYNELGKVAHVLQYDKSLNLTGTLTADKHAMNTALTTASRRRDCSNGPCPTITDGDEGRVVYSMNAAGYVTRNVYNALNQIIRSMGL